MKILHRIVNLLRNLSRKEAVEGDLDRETRSFLDLLIEEKTTAGMSWKEARREALIELGGSEQLKEKVREVRMGNMIEVFWQDVRFGLRMLRRSPGFTAVAVLTLALGIGANTAIFTFMKAFAIDYLPGIPEPSRLTAMPGMNQDGSGCCWGVSYLNLKDYDERAELFEGILGWELITVNLQSGGPVERVKGTIVTGNYFDVLGVNTSLGRTFQPEEDKTPGTHPVAVISHKLWQRHFNADPAVPGRGVTINNHPYTVIGVLPERLGGAVPGFAFDIFIPAMMEARLWPSRSGNMSGSRGAAWLDPMGRLKPGVTIEQAKAEIDRISLQLEEEYPGINKDRTLGVFTLTQSPLGIQGRLVPVLSTLMAIVGLVLLVACANVANLLLARAAGRRKEIALRMALGAARGRIVRQLLTENILLAILAGGAGLLAAGWAIRGLVGLMPPVEVPLSFNTGVDRYVLIFSLGVSLLTGLLFGLLPALRASNFNLVSALKDSAGSSRRRLRLQSGLVIAQVVFSVVALVSAGLFLRSMRSAQNFDAGFNPENALMLSLDLFPNGYTPERGRLFYAQLLEQVNALPGVVSATLARRPPLIQRGQRGTGFSEIEGYQTGPEERLSSLYDSVGPGYFRTLEIPLVAGRDFAPEDRTGSPPVTIVNETFAQKFWPGQDPLGKRIRRGDTWIEVVGVAKNVKISSLSEQNRHYIYAPHQQVYEPDMTLIVRSSVEPASLTDPIRRVAQSLDPALPLFRVMTLRQHFNLSLSPQRAAGSGAGVIGLLALGLAAVGLYGVVSCSVSQQTHEIGVRLALGARQQDVLWMVIRRGLGLTCIGLALGLAAAFGLSQTISSLLFGISPADPFTYAGISLLLLVAALLACLVPARRATKVDPMVALRYE